MQKEKQEKSKGYQKFSTISNPFQLVSYLESTQRDKQYIYHYTTIDRLIRILKSDYFFFSSLGKMNDLLEFEQARSNNKNYYVGSFSREKNEVIAMWGMYGIPWEMGVRLAIPTKQFRKWISKLSHVFEVSKEFKVLNTPIQVNSHQKRICCVSYINDSSTRLDWSNQQLYLKNKPELSNWKNNGEVSGYIKEIAWKYESEVRTIISIENSDQIGSIALPITEDLKKSFSITLSPKFDKQYLNHPHLQSLNFTHSKYNGMIVPRTICSTCIYNYKYKAELQDG
jgi:hypothetical protein